MTVHQKQGSCNQLQLSRNIAIIKTIKAQARYETDLSPNHSRQQQFSNDGRFAETDKAATGSDYRESRFSSILSRLNDLQILLLITKVDGHPPTQITYQWHRMLGVSCQSQSWKTYTTYTKKYTLVKISYKTENWFWTSSKYERQAKVASLVSLTAYDRVTFFWFEGTLGSASRAKFPVSLSNHVGFTPRLLYGSTHHSPERFTHLKTGWAQNAWLQWSYEN